MANIGGFVQSIYGNKSRTNPYLTELGRSPGTLSVINPFYLVVEKITECIVGAIEVAYPFWKAGFIKTNPQQSSTRLSDSSNK